MPMFKKVLIANRGAIACRIIRALDNMGIASVAVYSDADRHSRHVALAGEAVRIGPAPVAQSYLNVDAILAAARETGADGIHPGYGFLSENPAFAEACEAAGIRFIGPRPDNMRAFGLKHTARELAEKAGVPLAPGSGLLRDLDHAHREAASIGYPVMLKSTAGGGGIGLQLVASEDDLAPMFERVRRLAGNNFKDAGMFLEKFVARGRHIEVQIFGDGKGGVVALGERDCSAQRRNQKVIEETPAPNLPEAVRRALWETAIRLGQSVRYASAGTVEFLYDNDTGAFYFLEVNTRLQVEHGVTEEVTDVDLVESMVRQAADPNLELSTGTIATSGASIQVRLYAEDPGRDFRPSSGVLTEVSWPAGARVETWVETGTDVSPFYDPMLAKIIVTGDHRAEALAKMRQALNETRIAGIETNLDYLRALINSEMFANGETTTKSLDTFVYTAPTIEVVTPGTQTTVQDYPGRRGYWNVGVPPSGPMDHLSFRLANRAVGNPAGAAALEITLSGPTLKFNTPATIAICGAEFAAKLDGKPVEMWRPVPVKAGQTLALGTVTGAGARGYLAVAGGFDVPEYLGSKSTFPLGKFGGHAGRALVAGDILHVSPEKPARLSMTVPAPLRPEIANTWQIGVLYGPHGAPDFFTPDDIHALFSADWEVHYNSNRTGVRLIGPKPAWARTDGGEAGLHPSNIHDNAYAIGAVDFTGDMPVVLGPDGPSLGGFVCPVTVVKAELWKLGQLRPGDKVRFVRLTPAAAAVAEVRQDAEVATLLPGHATTDIEPAGTGPDDAIVGEIPEEPGKVRVVYRRAGDKYLLVEYGPIVLDLELRFRVFGLMTALEKRAIEGIADLTPGVRSLQIHYDSRVLPLDTLIGILRDIDAELDEVADITVPARIVRLPLSWDDTIVGQAIQKYAQSVRADAPWCPSNIEFIRRINGLDTIDDVKRTIFDASYLVLGLGDVYLGAPLATPVDPRHRLVTTKYNPARTWTAENSVGIGGAYMCVYGMEGPGGYQLFGRTCQMWNTYRSTAAFEPGKPWLLRFFDQVRFYEVSADELTGFRDAFLYGKAALDITETTFSLAEYRKFLAANADEIAAAASRRAIAFAAERARWQEADRLGTPAEASDNNAAGNGDAIEPGCEAVASPVPGSVWKIAVTPGARVAVGDPVVVVESMKMEIQVTAPIAGTVVDLRCAEGKPVTLGQTLAVIRAAVEASA